MARREHPFELRNVSASDVLDGTLDFDAYPHRYVFVHAETGFGLAQHALPRLLAAVEVLEDQGWKLINVLGIHIFYAVMRRPGGADT